MQLMKHGLGMDMNNLMLHGMNMTCTWVMTWTWHEQDMDMGHVMDMA